MATTLLVETSVGIDDPKQRLIERDRRLLYLYQVQGVTIIELAHSMGRHPTRVRQLIERAKKRRLTPIEMAIDGKGPPANREQWERHIRGEAKPLGFHTMPKIEIVPSGCRPIIAASLLREVAAKLQRRGRKSYADEIRAIVNTHLAKENSRMTKNGLHTIEFGRDKVREREGGYAIDLNGQTVFLKSSQIVSLTTSGETVLVTLTRQEFGRLTARTKTRS